MNITFTVPAVPVAQPRPRATIVAGHATVYEAPKEHAIHAFKATVRHAAAQVHQGAPLEGPLTLELLFIMPRPAKLCRKKDSPERIPCDMKRNDVDNLMKSVMDACNKRLWHDDGQIYSATVAKYYAAMDEAPSVLVTVSQ